MKSKNKKKFLIFCVISVFTLILFNILVSNYLINEEKERFKLFLSNTSQSLKEEIELSFSKINNLENFIIENHNKYNFESSFNLFASALLTPEVVTINAAPEGVIKFVYPLEGNESVIGHNLLTDEREFIINAVKKLIDTREIVLTGPHSLLHDRGNAIIVRKAIFIEDEFWGIINIVFEINRIMNKAGFIKNNENFNFLIQNNDEVLIYESLNKILKNPVKKEIKLIEEKWEILGTYNKSWNNLTFFKRIITLISSVLIIVFLNLSFYLLIKNKDKLEYELENMEEEIKLFFSLGLNLLCIVDKKGNFFKINKAWEKMIDFSEKEIEEKNILDFIHSEEINHIKNIFNNIEKEKHVLNFVVRFLSKNKTYEHLECNAYFKKDLIFIEANKITERIEYEKTLLNKNKELSILNEEIEATNEELIASNEELESTNEELENNYSELENLNQELKIANEVKSTFLSKVSHELRTPMNGILTGSSLALNTKTFSEMREYVEIINKSAERLLPVINNILDISKIEKKKTDIFCEKVDLIDFLESIVSPFENKAKQKNLNFIFSHFIKKSLFVNLDKTKFSQAIINVLDNSIKFTEKGFIQFSINLIEETESKISVLIKIKDTGIGIKKEFYEKLFVPFEQEEKYMTRKFGGTGLGLPISKELIEYMGGKIYFESEEGKGTTFFIEISFEKCSSIENLETELKKNEKDEKISILAAEDDELGVILLKKIFQDKKFDLDIVENGKKAIEYYEKKDYDLIFMDLQMPVMDGITATTLIREKEKSSKKSIPIIALTGHAFELDKKKCLDSGMNDFLSKPFKMNELFRTLNKYIS